MAVNFDNTLLRAAHTAIIVVAGEEMELHLLRLQSVLVLSGAFLPL